MPYYLLLIHTLAYHDTQYGFSEVIRLTEEELQDGVCDLGQHVLEKDGMEVAGISCFNPETGDLEEVRTLSPDSFSQGGDPESGEGYPAAQVLIEYQVVDGYRPVLQGDSTQLEDPYGVMPLNAFLNRPDLAEKAMKGELSQSKIQQALEDDSFSVNVDNAEMPVYQSQVNGNLQNTTYNNRYSDLYNQEWDNARSISNTSYTAQAISQNSPEHQGANPLSQPQLTVSLTAEQCRAALNASEPLTVTVYYRRNAGFYHVGHWVPKTGLSTENVNKYTTQYSTYNQTSVGPFDQGYLMVYLERKQGRVGALTNARAYPAGAGEAEKILNSFRPQAVNQKTIEADTRVDILYDTADRYGLIFQTEESYIPRQYVNKGYTVTFTTGGSGSSAMQVKDKEGKDVSDGYAAYENPTRQGYTFAGWRYEVRSDVSGDDVTVENGKHYKTVGANNQWEITSMKDVAVFMSWGATAGPFNQNYRNHGTNESTIIGNYRSMSADIIADPAHPETAHQLVAYWWNEYQSYYRRNAYFEVPGLTAGILRSAADVETFDLTKRELEHANIEGRPAFGFVSMAVEDPEKTRRDTLYLVPVGENSSLYSYFKDYASEFIEVNASGEPAEKGGYYAVRCISMDDTSNVYALGRQAVSVSTNYILAQAPSSMPAMTSVSFKYDLIYTWENNKVVEQTVSVDHDTQTWDNWGRTSDGLDPQSSFMAVGTIDKPYDIWFYYDRARFTIHYIVAARESPTGEYEIGTKEMISGEPLSKYNVKLDGNYSEYRTLYSGDEKFQNMWTATDNRALLGDKATAIPANSVNIDSNGYVRLAPNSAKDGTGEWTLFCWSLDRSSPTDMGWPEGRVTGNLWVFAQWTPPTYQVKFDFDGGSFTLKNPNAVQDLDDPSKEWRFIGWSPASGTNVISRSRSVAGEYPTLEIERSEGDLKFLANWELADKGAPPVDPEKPPVDPENPPVDPERPGSQEDLPTVLPDPNSPDAPELITILENGVPTTYRKVWDPEMETWIYIPEEDVPLHRVDVPDTGDHGVFPWGLLSILSFLGLVAILFQDRRKKKDSL